LAIRLTEVFKQADIVPLRFTDEAVILYVALAGYLDDVPTQRIKDFERELLDYIEKMYDDAIFGAISKSRTLDDATEATLKKAVEEFKRIFNNGHRTSSWTSDVQN